MSCTKIMFHAASNRVQRKASVYLEIDLNYSKERFHLKGSLESCAASLKQSTKSSSPINIRLQQEEHTLFEQKQKRTYSSRISLFTKSLKNSIFELSKLLFLCIKSLKKINTFLNSNTLVKEIVIVQKAQRL
jgi:hypothetical protein